MSPLPLLTPFRLLKGMQETLSEGIGLHLRIVGRLGRMTNLSRESKTSLREVLSDC